MTEHTPTTEEVRFEYTGPDGIAGSEFDRWLTAHDAEVGERIAQSIRALRSPNVIDMRSAGYNAGLESAALRAAAMSVPAGPWVSVEN